MKNYNLIVIVIGLCHISQFGYGQHDHGQHDNVQLHVNPRWEECSFQLDSTLTQESWHQFTREAALVAYFRPLIDAKPMGKKNFEIALLQWNTAIDDADDAWNDTFVHPDSAHWLKEGSRLPIPGLTFRAGIANRLDLGIYWTRSIGANYGFWGAQLQYNLVNNVERNWAASTRLNFVSMYGPEDLNLNVMGLDFLASKEFQIRSDRFTISPYIGVSTFLSNSHEKTTAVELDDEHVVGAQGMVGAVLKLALVRVAVEYNFSEVSTLSYKIGIAF
jgi:hypothetical protein